MNIDDRCPTCDRTLAAHRIHPAGSGYTVECAVPVLDDDGLQTYRYHPAPAEWWTPRDVDRLFQELTTLLA